MVLKLPNDPRDDPDRPLTAKEIAVVTRRRRVATLLGRCYTATEMAELLGVSTDTIARDIKAVKAEFAREMADGMGALAVWESYRRQHLARVRELWALFERSKGVYEEKDGKRVCTVKPDAHVGIKALRELRACNEAEIKTAQSLGIVYKAPERTAIDVTLMQQLSNVPESELDRLLAAPLDELPAMLEQMVGPELAARALGKPSPTPALPDVPEAEAVVVDAEPPADQSGAANSPEGLDESPASAQVAAAEQPASGPSSDPRPGGAPPMSWSQSYKNLADFTNDRPEYATPIEPALESEMTAQIAAARTAVTALIASGAVGGAGKDFGVQINGHVNPGHEPREGFATDYVAVTVSQRLPEAVTAPAEHENNEGDRPSEDGSQGSAVAGQDATGQP